MPDNVTPISEAFASGEDIQPIVERLEAALDNTPREHALIALTSLVLILQYPDITNDQLYDGVKDVSKYVCFWLSGAEAGDINEPLDPKQLN